VHQQGSDARKRTEDEPVALHPLVRIEGVRGFNSPQLRREVFTLHQRACSHMASDISPRPTLAGVAGSVSGCGIGPLACVRRCVRRAALGLRSG